MLRAVAFDFDGVLVESMGIKTAAFGQLFADEGPEVVRRVIAYHREHGGLSRVEKFKVWYRDILQRPLSEHELAGLCRKFSEFVVDTIVAAPLVDGAKEFLQRHRDRYVFAVVSGTPEDELTMILQRRKMADWFGAVLGSPATKPVLLAKLLAAWKLRPHELLFVGDSQTDWLAAKGSGVRFVWRQSADGGRVASDFDGPVIASLSELDGCCRRLEQRASVAWS